MKKLILLFALITALSQAVISQDINDLKPKNRWFFQPQVFAGYTIGNNQSGWGYGAGMRCLYDFEKRFLGGPLFLGMETTYLSSLNFTTFNPATDKYDYRRQNYVVISPVLEQNYSWLKNGFHIATGFGYYKGIQDNKGGAAGMITNIGWFPIYEHRGITPCITYRNDWVFDSNGTNMQSISLSLSF
jgi:hypothetical protein